jgi:hypothetical protein
LLSCHNQQIAESLVLQLDHFGAHSVAAIRAEIPTRAPGVKPVDPSVVIP